MIQAFEDAKKRKVEIGKGHALLRTVSPKRLAPEKLRGLFPANDAFLADLAWATGAALIVSDDTGRQRKGARKRGVPHGAHAIGSRTVHICSSDETAEMMNETSP